MGFQVLKGMKDVLPQESYKWQYIESVIREICDGHGFLEARTPVLEPTELFMRGVGAATDIVQKEMYTFTDKGDRSVTLKPEGTAGIARMFVENKLFAQPQPQKIYYLNTPLFRYERPQAGRLREHHQFGVELYGASLALADAECISLVFEILDALGIKSLLVNINSIGCPNCRPAYNEKLREFLTLKLDSMCDTCKTRFKINPLRILDCKEQECRHICRQAPRVIDCLCAECSAHFNSLQRALDAIAVPYKVDPYIVRGLDYYTKTVFEIVSDDLGAQSAICGGGRYDGLVEEVGGNPTPAVGFGMGLERLIMALGAMGVAIPQPKPPAVYIASMGENASIAAFSLTKDLRLRGIRTEFDHVGRSFKAQFKYADKICARFVVIIGDQELNSGVYKLKDMSTGEQKDIEAKVIVEELAALTE